MEWFLNRPTNLKYSKMLFLLSLIALALAPAIYLAIVIYGYDKYDREPKRILLIAFVLGALSIIPAGILEVIWISMGFDVSPNFFLTIFHAFIVVALSEELFKYLVLRYHAFRLPVFNEPFDGIVYGSFVALGFATIENLAYVLDNGWGVGVLRMFTAVPAHYCFGVIMGYYVGKAKFDKENRRSLLLKGLAIAVLLHGAYDFFIMQENFPILSFLTFGVLIYSWRLAKKSIGELREDSKFRFHKKSGEG